MTCGSEFRLKKLYLFLHIFVIFSRENSRLGTSPPMMKSVWSHLKRLSIIARHYETLRASYHGSRSLRRCTKVYENDVYDKTKKPQERQPREAN